MYRLIALLGVSPTILFWSSNSASQSIYYCNISATGVFDTGEILDGAASDTIAGGESIDWMHDAFGASFETTSLDMDGVICRLNGTTSADLLGTGNATYNGVPGHSYFIQIEDNRPAPVWSRCLQLQWLSN